MVSLGSFDKPETQFIESVDIPMDDATKFQPQQPVIEESPELPKDFSDMDEAAVLRKIDWRLLPLV